MASRLQTTANRATDPLPLEFSRIHPVSQTANKTVNYKLDSFLISADNAPNSPPRQSAKHSGVTNEALNYKLVSFLTSRRGTLRDSRRFTDRTSVRIAHPVPANVYAMRLIRGAPGSGKTPLVFREFSDSLRRGQTRLRIVVPTATLVRHYQHELARSGLVFDPGNVVTLSRFALECAPDLHLSPGGLVRALVRDALSRLQLPEFTQVASTRGMADVVMETMTLFENAACSPEPLSRTRNLTAHGKAFLRVWRKWMPPSPRAVSPQRARCFVAPLPQFPQRRCGWTGF